MRLVAKSTELARLPLFMPIVSHNSESDTIYMAVLATSHCPIF